MKPSVFVAAALLAVTRAMPDKTWGTTAAEALEHAARQEQVGVQQPKVDPIPGTWTDQGCYSSSGDLEKKAVLIFNTISNCSNLCLQQDYPVAGTMGRLECWCGNTYPPEEDYEPDGKNCHSPCGGFPQHACGGIGYWSIYNTGLQLVVPHYEKEDKKDDEKPKTTSSLLPTPSETAAKEAPSATESPEESGGGKNVGGIVVGVVVGVIVIASAIGGGFLWWRRKRNQEIEEEHRRNAAVNAFIGKPPSSSGGMSMADSRLDPVMAQRRMSDGSIADNQDYSRRILRVTNA
ncbi:hypothetical protein VTK26DRAFT_4777 [Humicola hyalothermophila]